MLVKITTQCRMGCSHCMEDAQPNGRHMPISVFKQVLELHVQHGFPFLMLSGGEPTEHPDFVRIAKAARLFSPVALVMSNGLWLHDGRCEEYLSLGIRFQIINDPAYYPVRVEPVKHKNIVVFAEKLIAPVSPIGRAKKNNLQTGRISPLCFNFRSCIHHLNDFRTAVGYLRHLGRMCTPSITVDGEIVAGESRFCSPMGNLNSSMDELTKNAKALRCSRCGLVDNLTEEQRKAIGE